MPLSRPFSILVIGLVGAVFVGQETPASAQSAPLAALFHTANLGNITNNFTKIDFPALNNNPNAVVLATPVGGAGSLASHVGVFYDDTSRKWAVFNEDTSKPMANGAKFHIVSDGGFVHRATAENTAAGWTRIDNPVTNNNPLAMVFVTQRWNRAGANNGYNNRAVGVWYESATRKWAIYNEDKSAMGAGLEFNVKVFNANNSLGTPSTYIVKLGPGNVNLPPASTKAVFIMTHSYNPGGNGATYLPGIWGAQNLPGSTNTWQVATAGGAALPNDTQFNVLGYTP